MSKYDLTAKQAAIVSFVRYAWTETKLPPSYKSIQHHFGYASYNTAQTHIAAIAKKGALEVTPLGILLPGMTEHINAFLEGDQ